MLRQQFTRPLRRQTSIAYEHPVWFRRHENCARLRRYTTSPGPPTPSSSTGDKEKKPINDSIFDSKGPVWDHVFSDIKEMPPLLPSSVRNLRSTNLSADSNEVRKPRRQTMTAREINAFDEMFAMIFNAVSDKQKTKKPSDRATETGVGHDATAMGDLFGKLRRHSRRMKWTTEFDELLDQKKEAMNLCDTDQQLLEWAMEEVFGESQSYEAAWRKNPGYPMQPPTYPHILAQLMREFRDKYHDPHLALAMFHYARNLSIASYVFGCSTQAYNELIETRWSNFKDLKGVHDALEEMVVNGVEFDSRTRKLVEIVRRDIVGQRSWTEANDLVGAEMWNMLTKIDQLAKSGTREGKRTGKAKLDAWKTLPDVDGHEDGEWAFGSWGEKGSEKATFAKE